MDGGVEQEAGNRSLVILYALGSLFFSAREDAKHSASWGMSQRSQLEQSRALSARGSCGIL